VSIPDERFEEQWDVVDEKLRTILRCGSDVLVHCRGGLGRAGTVAARLLVELGMDPRKAIAAVREVRPGAIEILEQEQFIVGIDKRGTDRQTRSMDWFESLTGFRETDYADTRAKLAVDGNRLRSLINGKSYGIGELELVPLQALHERAKSAGTLPGRLKVSVVTGDVRQMHRSPENSGALFQVASQFNLLEMVSPTVTPEQGITRYQYDRTQGPACAIAAGAATIYRNYFVPLGGSHGQTRDRQLDGLADLGETLSRALNQPVTVRGKLCIGIHRDVEVTDSEGENRPLVSQAFCSALPVAYSPVPASCWRPFATLVLQAAYEATMWAGVLNAQRGASNIVFLTSLGGGAFGNEDSWIRAAMRRALEMMLDIDLDVRLVSYGTPSQALLQMAKDFG
jgi:hypothetical protein